MPALALAEKADRNHCLAGIVQNRVYLRPTPDVRYEDYLDPRTNKTRRVQTQFITGGNTRNDMYIIFTKDGKHKSLKGV